MKLTFQEGEKDTNNYTKSSVLDCQEINQSKVKGWWVAGVRRCASASRCYFYSLIKVGVSTNMTLEQKRKEVGGVSYVAI